MSAKIGEVGDQNFDTEVLNSPVPVLVDFWAAWCAPCRMIAPVVEAIAEKYDGKARVVKLNVDDNAGTSAKYNIKGIPTLLLFKDGEVVNKQVGAGSKEMIEAVFADHV